MSQIGPTCQDLDHTTPAQPCVLGLGTGNPCCPSPALCVIIRALGPCTVSTWPCIPGLGLVPPYAPDLTCRAAVCGALNGPMGSSVGQTTRLWGLDMGFSTPGIEPQTGCFVSPYYPDEISASVCRLLLCQCANRDLWACHLYIMSTEPISEQSLIDSFCLCIRDEHVMEMEKLLPQACTVLFGIQLTLCISWCYCCIQTGLRSWLYCFLCVQRLGL